MKFVGKVKCLGNSLMVQTNHFIDMEDGEYDVEIKTLGKSRTERQNNLMWALCRAIAKTQDGHRGDADEVYKLLLQRAAVKTYTCCVTPKDLERIKSCGEYRGHRVIQSGFTEKGVKMDYIEVFAGSSKFDTKEMTQLIDVAMDWAEELGIETSYFIDLLKEI